MAKRILWAASVCALVVLAGAAALILRPATPSGPKSAPAVVTEPGGVTADLSLAVQNPDEYAWRLFMFVNRQAEPGAAGVADPTGAIRQYDPDAPVVWETWALVSGDGKTQVGSELYRPDGDDPGPWTALSRNRWPAKLLSERPSGHEAPSQEIRMNQPGYAFVRDRTLYNREGLQRAFAQAVAEDRPDLVQFPSGAKVVKAQWKDLGVSVAPSALARYHWRRIGGHYWGLIGLHIATKDLPTWFWADFEHVDDPLPPGEPSADVTTRTDHGSSAPAKGSVEGERRELTGSKWAYYRLRGIQISYTDARGVPVHFANAVIEKGFEHTSCMTCHARATVRFAGGQLTHLNPESTRFDGEPGPPVPDSANTDLGPPSPSLFGVNRVSYLQTDFVWSMPLRPAAKARVAP